MPTYNFDLLTEAELHLHQSYKWTEYPAGVIPAFVAEADFPLCREVQTVLHAAIDRHDLGYVSKQDKTDFAECVAGWLGRAFDWHPDPAHIFMIPDVVIGMDLAVQQLSEAGDGVIVTTPIYAPFLIFSRMEGRVQVPIDLLRNGGRWQLDLEAIDGAFASGRAKVLALCHPHNPTGTVFTVEELDALIASANRHGCFIVSDEIHAPFVYSAGFVPIATRPGADGVVVTVTSASKTWNLAGLKCAAIIASGAQLALQIGVAAGIKRPGVGLLGLIAMKAAYESGEPWRVEALAHLKARRDQLASAIASFDGLLAMVSPEATYLGWVDATGLMEAVGGALSGPAGWLLDEARVAFSPGSSFGPIASNWFRWNFGTTTALLDETIGRVRNTITART